METSSTMKMYVSAVRYSAGRGLSVGYARCVRAAEAALVAGVRTRRGGAARGAVGHGRARARARAAARAAPPVQLPR